MDGTDVNPQTYLNGEVIPVVDSDKHLGNYISTNITDRNIINNICDLYQRSNRVINDFRVCDSNALYSLHRTYCMHMYGCELWDLNCNYIKDFKVALRKIKRRIWRLPYRAHNAIIHQLSYDIDHQLETRMIKFVHLCLNYCNHVCRSIISSNLHLHQTTNICLTGIIFLIVVGISVYMPYQCDENYDLYMQCIGKLSTLLEESCTNNIVILDDFNATLNSVFESELLEMCSTFDLVISDYGTFGRTSGQFTHVSDAHGTTSWLDHVICSSDMQNNVVSIEILEKSPSSDHLALSVTFDIMCKPVTIDKHTCHSDKVRFVWDNATDTDVAHYKKLTAENFSKLKISDVIHCSNINCDSIEHHNQIDELYMKMCSIMMQCSSSSIPTSKVKTSGDYVVPGFNEYAKELHKEARSCFIAWKSLGKPRAGLCYIDMCQSRLRFKSILKHCQRNEDSLRANALAKSYMQKDSYSFWKDIKHIDNAKIPLASKINDCVGDTDICKMWQDHYQSLLNSVKNLEHKTSVTSKLSFIENESIEIRPLDIVNALKSVNQGKACGVDGLAAEHFIYADERIHVILSILFNCFISHGYLPSEFMKTAIVPIIKNKTGDTSDKNNYRPIALVTAYSKIFELCILSIIENYICTHDHQFGFKKQHATDMCIYTVKSVIKCYTRQSSPVYTCFLDASKAFDRISHWTLFKKLIACYTPVLIVRILMFWYQRQSICVKWGKGHLIILVLLME